MNTRKDKFIAAVEIYIKDFCEKQDLEFDFWIADHYGELAEFSGDYFFSLDNIRYDLDNDVKAGVICDWFSTMVDIVSGGGKNVNFRTFTITNSHTVC